MNWVFLTLVLSPCLLPVVGVALLASASLWRTMREDARRREALQAADRDPNSLE